MYPAYTWTDDPRTKEVTPSPLKMDLSSPRPMYQPWPYAGNYSYPVPHPYHGCCNHTYYGGAPYGFCPPYTHYPPPPPPPFHPHGFYSPFPGAYPVPPQHYSVEQPRYEYDKNHHCCGCNNREDDKGPKIEEEPQVDKKTSDSLLPLLLKDSPDYPIVWVPRGYTESKADKEKYSHDSVSVKHPQSLKRGGDGERAEDEQGGDGNRFPFQIFWLPSKDDEVGKDTKGNNLDLVPNKGLSDDKTAKNDEGLGECATRSNHAAQKVVPVKQASTNEETRSSHLVQKVIPVKQVSTDEEKRNPKSRDFMVNSDSMEKTDKASRTSPKAPKLPPVCLRIDPLPRKKRSSRSPSPGEKERSNGSLVNNPKSSEHQSQVQKKSNEEQSEGNMKTTDHANKVERENLADHGDNVPRGKGDESERKIVEKKNLSEHEAALIVQSVYRGFEVRKSQPLKKLRQINEFRKQVFELRNCIQDLESSSSSVRTDGKKEVIIGESIMSLLLKLDTIQGLHPFVREVRKSVAKELVGLQEKLDSLTSVKSETPSKQVMHPEDDAIQANSDQTQAHVGLCENHEHNAKESQYDDDIEACNAPNLEQQLKKNTEEGTIQGKFDVATTESGTVICENQAVEAAESQEDCNTIGEESDKEKFEQPPAECDGALRVGNHEMGAIETQEGCNTAGEPQLKSDKEKFSQAPTECDGAQGQCENHEVEATESQEHCNAIREPQLELDIENFDQAPTNCDEALRMDENHEVEAIESQEGCNTISEPRLESPTEDETLALCENHEVEITKSLEGCDTKGGPEFESDKQKLDEAQTECGEPVELCESDEVEAAKLQGGCNGIGEPQLESHKEKLDQAPTENDGPDEALGLCENHEVKATNYVDNGNVGAHDVKLEHNSQELNNNQLQMSVEIGVHGDNSIQDLVPGTNVETMMYDSDVCQRRDAESYNDSGVETCDNNLESQVVSCEHLESGHNGNDITDDVISMMEMKSELAKQDAAKEIDDDLVNEAEGGRGRLMLMEENEKLKVAVKELMKAGNEQLGVIRELTGRVKDLEKKLSKKKKVKVNKCRRSRGCVVQKD